MSSHLKNLMFVLVAVSLHSCILRIDPNWSDYSNDEKLDVNQLKHKEFCIEFFNAFNNGDITKLKLMSCDTIYCEWEQGLDSLQKWNSSPLPIDTFIKNYYPKVHKDWTFIKLYSTNEFEKSKENNIPLTGLSLVFGPKKCFDKCDYPTFEFKKIKNEYKFYKMWQY